MEKIFLDKINMILYGMTGTHVNHSALLESPIVSPRVNNDLLVFLLISSIFATTTGTTRFNPIMLPERPLDPTEVVKITVKTIETNHHFNRSPRCLG